MTSSTSAPVASSSSSREISETPAESQGANEPLSQVAQLIQSGKAKNIVILTGAGISTSAGIPDFRSPETGLYANLERLNLPFPEAVFELNYFKRNPVPFWTLAKDLYPGKYLPTPTHYFLTLLHHHELLLRTFTQNIDTLETLAGLPSDSIIEAHGSFASAHCLSCKKAILRAYVLEAGVRDGRVVKCDQGRCGGLVKPDIVFFGEGLPERFFQHIGDLKRADLVIVIGTSLQVHPFASLPQYCRPGTPRLLINREAVGPFKPARKENEADALRKMMEKLGVRQETSDEEESEDEEDATAGGEEYTFWEGDADEGVWRLAKELGLEEELRELIRVGNEKLRKGWAEAESGAAETQVDAEASDSDSSSDEEDDGKIPVSEISDMGKMLAEHLKRGEPNSADTVVE